MSRSVCARTRILVAIASLALAPLGAAAAPAATSNKVPEPELSALGPPLDNLSTKIADPNWLVAWLLRPRAIRPDTNMPDSELEPAEALAMARFLWGSAPAKPGTDKIDGDPQSGARLFIDLGCRGCHAIEPEEKSVSPRVPSLAGVGLKLRPQWLAAWLRNPRDYHPETPMPKVPLTDSQIADLVAFLMERREGAAALADAPGYDPAADPALGRRRIADYECYKCHRISGFPDPEPPFELAESTGDPEIDLRNGRVLVAWYNCRGCHVIEQEGGRIARFLERHSLTPPRLDGEGARVQTSWLAHFLRKPEALRPWLHIRMPDYGLDEERAAALAAYFARLAGVEPADEPVPDIPEDMVTRGLKRFAHYKCIQCHPSSPEGAKGADVEDLSINLMLARQRLRPSWIRKLLRDPKGVVGPDTRMPSVFFTADGVPKVEHPGEDIEAITAYLLGMSEPPEASLAALEAQRRAEEAEQEIDWTNYDY